MVYSGKSKINMIVNSPESTDRAMELICELLEDYEANSKAIHELAIKIEVYEAIARIGEMMTDYIKYRLENQFFKCIYVLL